MAKVLLPIISDAPDPRVVAAARALLDFMYLAHSSALTDADLSDMDQALRTFHANKDVFENLDSLQTREGFHGIPKIHMIEHYTMLIRMLGTPDGYNTETSERLHIDFAKLGYRASNRVNATKQMALYIQRMEAIQLHDEHLADTKGDRRPRALDLANLGELAEGEALDEEEEWDEWQEEDDEEEDPDELHDAGVQVKIAILLDDFLAGKRDRVGGRWVEEPEAPHESDESADQGPQRWHPDPDIVLAETPTNITTIANLQRFQDAPRLHHSLELYLCRLRRDLAPRVIWAYLNQSDIKLKNWSRARLFHSPPPFKPSEGPHVDVVRAQRTKVDRFDCVTRPARYDTVLLRIKSPRGVGIHSRVRAIFQLPDRLHHLCDQKLVYVEHFSIASPLPDARTGLHASKRVLADGIRVASVVPLSDIAMTCHLVPQYRLYRPEQRLNYLSDVLQLSEHFLINIFASYFFYELLRHWGQDGGN
ncbi:hypothetical protein FRC12_007948, partial [Ceratobasidium sp. 428]